MRPNPSTPVSIPVDERREKESRDSSSSKSPVVLSTSIGAHTNWQKYATSPGKSLIDDATPPKSNKGRRRTKSSSTNNPFLHSTITAPDTREIVKCISHTICCSTLKADLVPSDVGDHIWSEEFHALDGNKDAWMIPPTQEIVEDFLLHIFNHTVMSSECCVMALIYMDRLVEFTTVVVQAKNWRRLLLGALIVASKVWEDDAVWNEDFLQPFPSMKISDLGELERYYLNGLQFSVTIKPSVYAEYYFKLLNLSNKNETNYEPLDEETAQRLYLRSKGLEDSKAPQNSAKVLRRKSAQRTYSLDAIQVKKVPISTEQISFPKKDVVHELGEDEEIF